MLLPGLVARALRWRAAASLAVFVVAVLAVLSATVGPVYLAAANQLVFSERLADVPQGQRDIMVSRDTVPSPQNIDWSTPVRDVAQVAGDSAYYGEPVQAVRASVDVIRHHKPVFATRLASVENMCDHLHFVTGTCPGATTKDVALSVRAARMYGVRTGDKIVVTSHNEQVPFRLTVVGTYQPIDPEGTYWAPWSFFDQGNDLFGFQVPRLDTFFVPSTTLSARIKRVAENISADVPLFFKTTRVGDEGAIRDVVAATKAEAVTVSHNAIYPTTAGTQLINAFNRIDHEISLTTTLVNLATVQLALLSICVLYALVSATATSHGGEVALAKLRGRRRSKVLAQGLIEPVLLVVVAAPIGAMLAWLATKALAHRVLDDIAVGFPAQAVAVAVTATLAAVVAAGLAARRILTTPIASLLRRGTESQGSSVGLIVADVAALTIAVAGLVQLNVGGVLTAGKPNPLSSLAPTLLAIAVAVIGLRLLPLLMRSLVRATRESRRLVPFLASRQLLRRSGGSRLVLLTAVALALATLAVTTWAVGRTNREYRALNTVGAHEVLTVQPKDGVDLEDAVRKADPSGTQAMAVAILPVNSTPLLAVDSARMPGIAAWRPDYSTSSLSSVINEINPSGLAPTVTVAGSSVQLDITLHNSVPSLPIHGTLTVITPTHFVSPLELGVIANGSGTYRADLPPACSAGCRLASYTFAPGPNDPLPVEHRAQSHPTVRVRVTSFTETSAGGQRTDVDAGLGDGHRWRGDGVGTVGFGSDTSTPAVTVSPEFGDSAPFPHAKPSDYTQPDWPTILSNDVPDRVPAVLAAGTAKLYPGEQRHDLTAAGLDGSQLPLDGSIVAQVLPQLGKIGTMAELHLVELSMTAQEASGVQHQVWLSPSAPADMDDRLAAQGLRVVHHRTAQSVADVLDQSGPALADTIFLVAAVAATVLAIGATVLGGLVTARRRSYELAALEAVGVTPRTLRRATAAEQAMLIGLGLVLGVAAGVWGSLLALPSTPIFVDPAVGPPIEYTLPVGTLFLLAGALVVVLALICLVMARTVEHQATAARLREAAP